jgi:amino acid adenylation domain-containing protein
MSGVPRGVTAAPDDGVERYDGLTLLHEPFEAVARAQPDAIAVVAGDESATYAQLDALANGFAGSLAVRGIGPESMVGICVDRSVAAVVALLGIVKSGAAFVPLDHHQPDERLHSVVRLADLALIVADGVHVERFAPTAVEVLPLDATRVGTARACPANLDNAVYVYFTSGTSGEPKGAVVAHRGASGRMEWLRRRYGLGEGDRVLHKTPLTFDPAVWEVFGTLGTGATVLMAEPDGERDPEYLADLIASEAPAFVHFVPSMLRAYLRSTPRRAYEGLKWVQVSGEAMTPSLLAEYTEHFEVELHNMYGQNETSEVARWEGRVGPEHAVPIGRPIGIYRLFVLDDGLGIVPPGVPGELCVAGVGGLARGYLGQASRTAERFVPNPYAVVPGERLYLTGDVVVEGDDGQLVFVGRNDTQVKVRGSRVELDEVAAMIARHPSVRDCTVVVRSDNDDQELIAYVVGVDDVEDVARFVEERLPQYMRPAVYVRLDSLPVASSGKPDKSALPPPTPRDRGARSTGEAPVSAVETLVAAIWIDILHVPQVSRADSFFALGGNSLKSLQMINRVRDRTGISLRVRDVFAAPTLAGTAAAVERALVESISDLSDAEVELRLGTLGRSDSS